MSFIDISGLSQVPGISTFRCKKFTQEQTPGNHLHLISSRDSLNLYIPHYYETEQVENGKL